MKGTLYIIHPDKPIEIRMVSHQLNPDEYQTILRGHIDILPLWDHHIDFAGRAVPCTVLYNDEAAMQQAPFNLTATSIWQFIAKIKGHKHDQRISGAVIIVMGDEEFLASVLD